MAERTERTQKEKDKILGIVVSATSVVFALAIAFVAVLYFAPKEMTGSTGKAVSTTVDSMVSSVAKVVSFGSSVPTITGLSATENKVTVSWREVSGAEGYAVSYKKKGTQKWSSVLIKDPKKTTKTIKNLKSKTTYLFKVRSYKMNGTQKDYSEWSEQGGITTK